MKKLRVWRGEGDMTVVRLGALLSEVVDVGVRWEKRGLRTFEGVEARGKNKVSM